MFDRCLFCKSLISVCVTYSKCIISSPTWLVPFWPRLKIGRFFLFNCVTPGDVHVTHTRFEKRQLSVFQFNLMFLWEFQAGYDKQMQTHTPANAITHKRVHIYNTLINCCPQAVVACHDWGGSLVNTQWFTAVQCAFTYNGSLHHRDQPEKNTCHVSYYYKCMLGSYHYNSCQNEGWCFSYILIMQKWKMK